MAEEEEDIREKEKGAIGSLWRKTFNAIKIGGVNRAWVRIRGKKRKPKTTEIPVSGELEYSEVLKLIKGENLITIMQSLNKLVMQIEVKKWNKEVFDSFFDRIAELYKTVGPYTSAKLTTYERRILGFGMKQSPEEWMFRTDEIYNYTDKVRIAAFGKVFKMPIPKEVTIEHPSGLVHYLRVWGEYPPKIFREIYKAKVKEICNQARKYYVNEFLDDIRKELENETKRLEDELKRKKERLAELEKRGEDLIKEEKEEKDKLPGEIEEMNERMKTNKENLDKIEKGDTESLSIIEKKEKEERRSNLLERMFTQIEARNLAFQDLMTDMFTKIKEYETSYRHETYNSMERVQKNLITAIQTFLNTHRPKTLGKIHCVHSYRVLYRTEYEDDRYMERPDYIEVKKKLDSKTKERDVIVKKGEDKIDKEKLEGINKEIKELTEKLDSKTKERDDLTTRPEDEIDKEELAKVDEEIEKLTKELSDKGVLKDDLEEKPEGNEEKITEVDGEIKELREMLAEKKAQRESIVKRPENEKTREVDEEIKELEKDLLEKTKERDDLTTRPEDEIDKEKLREINEEIKKLREKETELRERKIKIGHDYTGNPLSNGNRFTWWKDYDKELDWEKAPGLDENGMWLEVGDDQSGNERKVLSDIWLRELYERKKSRGRENLSHYPPYVRELTEEEYEKCTDHLDWMQQFMAMHNEWDRLRDDARDGRYHPYSLTAYDYVLAAEGKQLTVFNPDTKKPERIYLTEDMLEPNPENIGFKPSDENSKDFIRSQRKVDMFKSYIMKLYRGNDVINEVPGIRKAYHLSPAFDKRAVKTYGEWRHAGTIYWYGTPDDVVYDILPDELQPHITSRGIALYVIDKVLRWTKYVKDMHGLLTEEIAPTTKGFDYGPRLFRTEMTMDPFKVEIEDVVKKIREGEEKYTREESGGGGEG